MHVISGSVCHNLLPGILMYTNKVFVFNSSSGEMHSGILLSLEIKQALNCFMSLHGLLFHLRYVRQSWVPLCLLLEIQWCAGQCCMEIRRRALVSVPLAAGQTPAELMVSSYVSFVVLKKS